MKYLIANWKMKHTIAESDSLARAVHALVAHEPLPAIEVVLCPSFPALSAVADSCKGGPVIVGAQDAAETARGSLTGAVSTLQLQECGVTTVIIGHSERRHIYHEDDALIHAKVGHCLAAGMRTILCVGEQAHERAAGDASTIIYHQVVSALTSLAPSRLLMVAYEPVWAIGSGTPVRTEDAHEQVSTIQRALTHVGYSADEAAQVPVLYGGSVDASTIATFTASPLSGTLVGTASQTLESFTTLYHALA